MDKIQNPNKVKSIHTVVADRSVKKYSGKIQDILFRRTKSDKRKAIFGRDPFAG